MRVSRFENELRWLHKVWLYPTCAQERELFVMLRTTRELYNAMLEQRRDAWKTRPQPLSGQFTTSKRSVLMHEAWRNSAV
jgi:hypothetical protein